MIFFRRILCFQIWSQDKQRNWIVFANTATSYQLSGLFSLSEVSRGNWETDGWIPVATLSKHQNATCEVIHLRVQVQNNKHSWNKRKNFAEILRAKECTRQEKNDTVKKYFILCQNCIKGKYVCITFSDFLSYYFNKRGSGILLHGQTYHFSTSFCLFFRKNLQNLN